MVDANQIWDIGKAMRAIAAFEASSPYWVEEPLLCDDIDGHARLRRSVRSPIAIGENVYTLEQFNQYLARGACDFVQADLARVGGITPFLDIAALCARVERAAGAALHDRARRPGAVLPAQSLHPREHRGRLAHRAQGARRAAAAGRRILPPADPAGHGLVFDRDYLKAHAVA